MGKLVRFGVSLDEELLEQFDKLCRQKKYATRSEALRDLIRGALATEKSLENGPSGGVLILEYDHHKHDLARKLMEIQHDDHELFIATMHMHMDHYNCLEVSVLKGDSQKLRDLSHRLISCKGVKLGIFNPVPGGGDLP